MALNGGNPDPVENSEAYDRGKRTCPFCDTTTQHLPAHLCHSCPEVDDD